MFKRLLLVFIAMFFSVHLNAEPYYGLHGDAFTLINGKITWRGMVKAGYSQLVNEKYRLGAEASMFTTPKTLVMGMQRTQVQGLGVYTRLDYPVFADTASTGLALGVERIVGRHQIRGFQIQNATIKHIKEIHYCPTLGARAAYKIGKHVESVFDLNYHFGMNALLSSFGVHYKY